MSAEQLQSSLDRIAAGETVDWEPTQRYGLHHATVNGDTAYGAWRDAGLVMIDVDRFKRFNDEHGHQAGHAVLSVVGEVLAQQTRNVIALLDAAHQLQHLVSGVQALRDVSRQLVAVRG